MDKYDLYELCVTDGPRLAAFARAAHGGKPNILREDFSGTAALARAWIRAEQTRLPDDTRTARGAAAAPRARNTRAAIAVDLDPRVLARAARQARRDGIGSRLTCRRESADTCRARADIVAATNFPLGYWHTRPALIRYLRGVHRSLKSRGIFFCDTYGGRDAFTLRRTARTLRGPARERIRQVWEQRTADPTTAIVRDVISFRVSARGKTRAFDDAFVYDWRLWTIPELRDALSEVGFSGVEVHHRLGDAVDHEGNLYVRALDQHDDARAELGNDWVVYLVARR